MEFIDKLGKRLSAFLDKSAWVLVVVGAVVLGLSDVTLLEVLAKWTSFTFIVAGIAIVLSKIVFPTISLSEHLEKVKEGSVASGLVVAAIVVFVASVIYSVIFWAKG